MINAQPVLVLDSDVLYSNIIFSANVYDNCGLCLDYDNLIHLIEYEFPICNKLHSFSQKFESHLFDPLDIAQVIDCFGNDYIEAYMQPAFLMLDISMLTKLVLPLASNI